MRWFAAALILSLAACGGDPAGSSSSSSGGSSGTTGAVDSAGTSSLSGSLAFDVKQSIEVTYAQSDGTVDTTWLEVDLTDDGSESCVVQEGGYSDGGGPTSLHHLLEISVDAPTGVQLGVAYPSLTTAQELNAVADGGGLPSAAFAQVAVLDEDTVHLSVAGTVTFQQDSATSNLQATFSVTLAALDGGDTSTLSGTTEPGCGVEFQ